MNGIAFKFGAGVVLALAAVAGVLYLRSIAPATAAAAGRAVNPLNPDNVFAQGSNALTRAVTGDAHASTGTALHGLLNPDFERFGDWLAAPVTFSRAGKITSPVPDWIPHTPIPTQHDILMSGGDASTQFWYGAP